MKKFVCAICQLLYIDPLQVPIATLLLPFIVYQYKEDKDPKNPTFAAQCAYSFEVLENEL